MTVIQDGPGAEFAPTASAQGLPTSSTLIEGTTNDCKVVRPWEVASDVQHQSPTIYGHTFRYVKFQGPALIFPRGSTFYDIHISLADNHVESVMWEWGDRDAKKLGLFAVENCRFEHCIFEDIGFTGAQLDDIRALLVAAGGRTSTTAAPPTLDTEAPHSQSDE